MLVSRPGFSRVIVGRQAELGQLRRLVEPRGYSNGGIAGYLVISRETVAVHVSNVLAKAGFERRTQVATWALQHGIVQHRPDADHGSDDAPRTVIRT